MLRRGWPWALGPLGRKANPLLQVHRFCTDFNGVRMGAIGSRWPWEDSAQPSRLPTSWECLLPGHSPQTSKPPGLNHRAESGLGAPGTSCLLLVPEKEALRCETHLEASCSLPALGWSLALRGLGLSPDMHLGSASYAPSTIHTRYLIVITAYAGDVGILMCHRGYTTWGRSWDLNPAICHRALAHNLHAKLTGSRKDRELEGTRVDQTHPPPQPPFSSWDTVAQRTEVICPRSHSIGSRGKI